LAISAVSVTQITATSAQVAFPGTFAFVNLYRTTVTTPSSAPVLLAAGYETTTYQDTYLSPNTQRVVAAEAGNNRNGLMLAGPEFMWK
jgi:uncharacterized membrane protein